MSDSLVLRVYAQYIDSSGSQSLGLTYSPAESILAGLGARLRTKLTTATVAAGLYTATLDLSQFSTVVWLAVKNLDNGYPVQVTYSLQDITNATRSAYGWAAPGAVYAASQITPATQVVLTSAAATTVCDVFAVGT